MKIRIRYPVLASAPLVGQKRGPMAFALKLGEFEIPSFDEDQMPLEIDFLNLTYGTRQQYRVSPDRLRLHGEATSISRIAKIEKCGFDIRYAPEHPLRDSMFRTHEKYADLLEKGMDQIEECGDGTWIEYVNIEDIPGRSFAAGDVAKCHQAAQEVLDGFCVVDGKLWRPTSEPYFVLNKSRDRWTASLHETRERKAGPDEFFFAVNEFEHLQDLLASKVDEGQDGCEMTLTVGGEYGYDVDSVALNVISLARQTVMTYASLTSAGHNFALEEQSVALIEAYLKLRRAVELPLNEASPDVIDGIFETLDFVRQEAKALGLRSPVSSPKAVEQQRSRWHDRPISVEMPMASQAMKSG